jgi:hypothetical protein
MAVDIRNISKNIRAHDSQEKISVAHWSYKASGVGVFGIGIPCSTEYAPGESIAE